MGVGDYVHSREAGQPRAPVDLGPLQRKLRGEQTKVVFPFPSIDEPNSNENTIPRTVQQSDLASDPPHPILENPPPRNGVQRDPFDTDVEGVDDSTIAGTSVFGHDDDKSQVLKNGNAVADATTSPRPSYLPRPTRGHRNSWYGGGLGLGDQAMKKAGFDSDDPGDTTSQATSSTGADDEQSEIPNDKPLPWLPSHKHRSTEEPLSKRLETFWSASRRTSSKPVGTVTTEPQTQSSVPANITSESQPPPRKLGHMLPPTSARKIVLPHSMSGTPRTRFSPPKPSLLDRLEISPTRHGSEPPPQIGRNISMSTFQDPDHSEDGSQNDLDETIRIGSSRASEHSVHPFDMTNLSDLERDEDRDGLMHDPFLTRPPKRERRNTVIRSNKRQLEGDYPPQVLHQKTFDELQAEPFDKAPTPTPPPVKSPPLPPNPAFLASAQSPNDAVTQLLRLTDQDRQTYLSRMSVDEWEDCGDQLIDRFSHLLTEMKQLRRARRRTAAVFENEVLRRHEQIETQNSELSLKLNEMRTGGAEVLRGRSS
ncbi:hypothetical protein PENSTE_c001G00611 [Penicillium steckii]|uniref:Extracellular mutant protein 11 C-terminal domain-containing protein n=1 Tax=Penicillium steckii TaxID=303698 RepID=A0A1V6U2H2_9EURO|nr:hypothetical protein PENSTE_c001G00611 [Penicillium steckii]